MFQIETAGLVIRIDNRYEDVRELCRGYITSDDRKPDICVSVDEEELQRDILKFPGYPIDVGYVECIALYWKIGNALPAFDGFAMQSSVVEVDGKAYAFAADGRIGKSAYTKYWMDVLGDRIQVINGDKPIYRFKGNKLMAYGTPWCGREGWKTRVYAPLKALCLLEQGRENAVYTIDAYDVLGEMANHFHIPEDGQVDLPKLVELVDRMLERVPVYRLKCRNDRSAARKAITYFGL